MNGFKRVIVWALISIIMQAAVLLYLDKVYFKTSTDFGITEADEGIIAVNIDIPIPKEATKIEISCSGKYVSYYIGSKLYLLDVKAGNAEEIVTNNGKREVLYSTWITDSTSDRLVIAEKKISNFSKKNVISPFTFVAKSKLEQELIKPIDEKKDEIFYTKGMEVSGIETVPKNGFTYIPISKSGGTVNICSVNINNDFKSINTQISAIGDLKVFPNKEGSIIYEDKKNKRFYKYINGKASLINEIDSSKYKILGIDGRDLVYMGQLSGEKITKIVYGTLDSKFSTWQTIQIDKGIYPNEIFITDINEILVDDSVGGKVKNLTTNQVVSYQGKFMSVNNKVILSKDDEKLYVTSLSGGNNKSGK